MTKQIVVSIFDMTHSVSWLWQSRNRRTPRSATPAGQGRSCFLVSMVIAIPELFRAGLALCWTFSVVVTSERPFT